jgi:hypothetical protein
MSEKKTSILPSLELLIIAAFFIGFAFWAINKCSSTRSQYISRVERERQRELEDSLRQTPTKTQGEAPKNDPATTVPTPSTAPALSRLYVSIEGLKVRRNPSTEAEVLETLSLFDEVYFLNQVTDSLSTVNLGKQTVSEPWIKVQTRKGRAGWVFGAGVHYYRRKHPGAD